MTGALVTAALIAGALLLALGAPRGLARWATPRTSPAEALLLWQSAGVSAVLCALLAAPVAALTLGLREHPTLLGMACAVSALMLARVLWSGHRVGTDLRRRRARHREVVDLVGDRLDDLAGSHGTGQRSAGRRAGHPVAVLATANPTAYCLPGRHDRIVLSRAALDRLGEPELAAVLAHEQAHLEQRHDLLLELFTVLHEAVPAAVRAPAALREVHLLAEVLADRRAADRTHPTDLARALVAMASPGAPGDPAGASSDDPAGDPADVTRATGAAAYPPVRQHALAVTGGGTQVRTRLALLAAPPAPAALRTGLVAAATALLLLPLALVAVALL